MELFLLHCNSHGIDDEIESIIFIALELLLLSWLDLRLAHGSRFMASLSFSHRKASFFSVFLTDPPQLSLLVWILMSFILSSICSFQGAVLTVLPVIRYQELPDLGSLVKAFLMFRQPPALPCRLQHSTIGRLGLNHRVRDGNGCDPQAHRHRNFFVVP